MKKNFSLDYSIELETERAAAVTRILADLTIKPTPADLELMANYILYGRDANGLNAVQRGEITDENRRFANSHPRKSESTISLDYLRENASNTAVYPLTERRTTWRPKPLTIDRPYRNEDGTANPGDSTIPGMAELWASIDALTRRIAINDGKLAGPATALLNPYHLYLARHQLIDLCRDQYFLKEHYIQPIHFNNITHSPTPTIDWSSDSGYWLTEPELKDKLAHDYGRTHSTNLSTYKRDSEGRYWWCVDQHTIDYCNPVHIRALINNIELLRANYAQKTDTYAQYIIWDYDSIVKRAILPPAWRFLLRRREQHYTLREMHAELEAHGVHYNFCYLNEILHDKIPAALTQIALADRDWATILPEQYRICNKCHRALPPTSRFFGAHRKDGSNSFRCRECAHKIYERKMEGVRRKMQMSQMQTTTANNTISPNTESVSAPTP